MKFLQRNRKAPNEATFKMEDFIVLNYEQLLKVNGAGGRSGSGGHSGPTGSASPTTPSSGSGSSAGSAHQTPSNPNDAHCDIIAYNQAVDKGKSNPGKWDGNHDSVDQIYKNNYNGQGSNVAPKNTSGYVFYDWNNDGKVDHMEYYEAGSGSDYKVYQTDGVNNPTPKSYNSKTDSNGSANKGSATFVPLN